MCVLNIPFNSSLIDVSALRCEGLGRHSDEIGCGAGGQHVSHPPQECLTLFQTYNSSQGGLIWEGKRPDIRGKET